MKSEMTPRDRLLAAIDHQPTDRLPVDFWGVSEISKKLMDHLGVNDWFDFAKALNLDKPFGASAPLIKEGRSDMWNVTYQEIKLPGGEGVYYETDGHPLADYETIDEIEANYEWPTTDMFDYSGIKEQCVNIRNKGYAVEIGYISLTWFYTSIRGIEQMLYDFGGNSQLAEHILFRINEFASAHIRKMLEAADGLADITQITDDFGSQHGLLMSKAMIDRYVGKYYDSNIAMAREFNVRVFHHDDGAIMNLIPWICGKGINVLNPIQWHLPGWDLHKLKSEYGKDLCFHGGIDNQHVLPFGKPDEIRAEVRACIDALWTDKTGYILAPCHNVQANTPVENVLLMYEYAQEYSAKKAG